MSDTQLDLFGEPIQPKRQKKAKLVQSELFPARELAQFGVRANPVMDESPGKLALQIQDVRTPDEIERDKMRTAEDNTLSLPELPAPMATGLLRGLHGQPGTPIEIMRQIRPGLYSIRSADGKTADVWEHEITIDPPQPETTAAITVTSADFPSLTLSRSLAAKPASKQPRITPYQKAMLLLIHTGKQDKHNPMILSSLTARKLVVRHEGRLVLTDAGRAYLQF